MALGRFRYAPRWSALRSVSIAERERAELERRDRQVEDYLSSVGLDIDALRALSGILIGDGSGGFTADAVPLSIANGGTNTTTTGASSGYDADKLDGQHGSYYLDVANATQGAWIDFSASIGWVNVTAGNGTLVARYKRLHDRTIVWRMKFSLGSTSDVTGSIQFNLPVEAAYNDQAPISAMAYNGTVHKLVPFTSTTTVTLSALDTSGATATALATTGTVPFDWNAAAGYNFSAGGVYEAAS